MQRIVLLIISLCCMRVMFAFPVMKDTLDPALVPPTINTSPLPNYGFDQLDYGMNRGIAATKKGRIWNSWVAGGDNEDAFMLANYSDNKGKTWSAPKVVIDPHNTSLPLKRRSRVGNLWVDPLGKLWFFFDQVMTTYDGRSGTWYTVCENPDSETPVWSAPQRIWHGSALNKPIVLTNGTWVLPIALWDRTKIKDSAFLDAYHELDSLRGAHVFLSTNQGATWEPGGYVRFPQADFDEHHVTEKKDGSLWMTARTKVGIYQSTSYDGGKSWSKPTKYMNHINSRHFIQRLSSGNLLLVKHGDIQERTKSRSKLMAFLSYDDGQSWVGGLVLDERRGVSYPDGFQWANGTISVSWDHNRDTDGEVLMASFTEKDIIGNTQKVKRILVCKPLGLDKQQAPSKRER